MKKKIRIFIMLQVMVLLLNINWVNCYAQTQVISLTQEQQNNSKDIVDIASEDGRFKTLVTALKASGLVDTVKVKAHLQYLHLRMMPLQSFHKIQSMIF